MVNLHPFSTLMAVRAFDSRFDLSFHSASSTPFYFFGFNSYQQQAKNRLRLRLSNPGFPQP